MISHDARHMLAAFKPFLTRLAQSQKLLYGLLLTVTVLLAWLSWHPGWNSNRIYRVGFDDFPPYHLVHSDGSASGLIIDIFNEAARREGLVLEWVHSPEGPQAIDNGLVDLWPTVPIKAEKQRTQYVTSAWMSDQFCMLSLKGSAIDRPADVNGRKVAYPVHSSTATLATGELVTSISVPKQDYVTAATAVCTQEVDAALLDLRVAQSLLLERPMGCEQVQFRLTALAEGTVPLGIGSTEQAEEAAGALRKQILRLAQDGTLTALFSRWSLISTGETASTQAIFEAQRHTWALSFGILLLVSCVVYAGWLIYRIRKSSRAAEALAAVKSDFLATMSHEIRTPMNGILGMVGFLQETPLNDDQRSYVDMVKHSSDALMKIINDILDFSKMEAGKLVVEKLPVNLRALVEEVTHLLSDSAQRKGVEIACRYTSGIPTHIVGDAGRLRQVLLNLVGNAIKFTEKGHVYIDVNTTDSHSQSEQIRIAVEDTGIGIPKEKHHQLFQKFSQVEGSNARQQGGTGLGLAISKKLVELMGGTLSLASVAHQGSTLTVTLPLIPAEISREDTVQIPASIRVLVVEGSDLHLRILNEQLTEWRIRHVNTSYGDEALQLIQRAYSNGDPFQIVLCALQLADMDGETLMQRVKSAPQIQSTLFVLMLSPSQKPALSAACQRNIVGILAKPVRNSQLRQALLDATSKIPGSLILAPIVETDRPPRAASQPTTNTNRSSKILVVEDDEMNQRVTALMLKKLGYDFDLAKDGKEAIDRWSSSPYQLILMDCQMPRLNGFEATSEIRGREKGYDHVPIIAMTANALTDDREKCLAVGMDDYLSKPIHLDQLRVVLLTWCDPAGPESRLQAVRFPHQERSSLEQSLP